MLTLGCFVLMVGVAWASMRDGLILAFTNLVNVLLAIVISFGLWPTSALELEISMRNGTFDSLEDAIPLLGIFVVSVVALRFATRFILGNRDFGFSDLFNRGGSLILGLATGYFATGFLILVLQTLPWQENFLEFKPEKEKRLTSRMMPGDQVVLKMLLKIHTGSLTPGFGPEETDKRKVFEDFEQVFADHRRFTETRDPKPYFTPEQLEQMAEEEKQEKLRLKKERDAQKKLDDARDKAEAKEKADREKKEKEDEEKRKEDKDR